MTDRQKKGGFMLLNWWISFICIFVVFMIVFFIVDGTIFEPNLNDSDNVAGKAADWLEETELFNVWFTPFNFPWFNLVTLLYIVFLLVSAIVDTFSLKRDKQN